jgi:hypothetical protein
MRQPPGGLQLEPAILGCTLEKTSMAILCAQQRARAVHPRPAAHLVRCFVILLNKEVPYVRPMSTSALSVRDFTL